ncbi:MAG: hypothetical protein AAF919_14080 [Pseudomonadota bacterium]
MIEADDLKSAVQSGLLTEAQAAQLTALAAERQTGRKVVRAGEEPFELFRGFNEVFIVVGLGILGFGWVGVLGILLTRSGDFQTFALTAALVTGAVILGLAEYFIRRRRMVAPAILLSVGWTATALAAWLIQFNAITLFGGFRTEVAAGPIALAAATTGVFWWRYRVPFAMALIGVQTFGAWLLFLATTSGQNATLRDIFLLSSQGPLAWGTLLFGLGIFAFAMRFDMSDPHRVTLRSANGFWLHVIAAPAIVNTVALTLIVAGQNAALIALLAIVAALAIVIDRRSFLLSAVGYVIVLIGQISEGDRVMIAILALGVGLVALGAAWQGIRRWLMRGVPATLVPFLPPSR